MKEGAVNNSIYDTLILLVDNDEYFLMKVKDVLENAGFQQVIIAKSCLEALALCEGQNKPYLVIMDFDFRNMTGHDFIRKVSGLCDELKVIVLSGSRSITSSFKALESGALSYIQKSNYDWKTTLVNSVSTWLNHYQQRDLHKIEFREKLNNLTVAI